MTLHPGESLVTFFFSFLVSFVSWFLFLSWAIVSFFSSWPPASFVVVRYTTSSSQQIVVQRRPSLGVLHRNSTGNGIVEANE
jgi:hypothetical protein